MRNGEYENAKRYALELAEIFWPGPLLSGASGSRHPGPGGGEPGHSAHSRGDGAAHGLHQRRPLSLQGGRPNQDVLMCVQMGKTVDDPNRMKFETEEFYLKSEEEMASLFPDFPSAFPRSGASSPPIPSVPARPRILFPRQCPQASGHRCWRGCSRRLFDQVPRRPSLYSIRA